MSSWRNSFHEIPPWNERPKCHCGFRSWLQVWTDPLPKGKMGCRFFKCPDLDDDFKACTFLEWVDKKPLQELDILKTQVETKMRYRIRLEEAREAARLARVEQERRVRQQEIRVKGKEAQLKRRREKLSEQEAALQMQEEEYKARQAQLRKQEEEERNKFKEHGQSSSSDPRKGKGKAKFIHYTQ